MERRSCNRIAVDLPGIAILDSGSRVPVRILDLSDGGAQIECDAFSSAILAPAMSCLDESGRVRELNLDCCLETPVRLRCRLVFVRRLSFDVYRIGLSYADPLQPELVTLKRYLRRGL